MNTAFRFGANFRITGKTNPQQLSYAGAWEIAEGTMRDLSAHHSKGHPWMPALLSGNGKRWQSNATYAEVLAVDIDGGLTIEQATKHPFIGAYAGLGIESSSSTADLNKFRLVFRLSEPIRDWQVIRIANRYLINLLEVADPACKDASRFFFGGQGRSPFLLNEASALPAGFTQDAIAWAEEQDQIAEEERKSYLEKRQQELDANGGSDGEVERVREALAYIPCYIPGNNTYNDLRTICAGVLNDLGQTGESLLIEWDGGQGKWGQPFSKWLAGLDRSRTNRPASLRSLFYWARFYGWRPQKAKTAKCINRQVITRKLEEPQKMSNESVAVAEEKKPGIDQIGLSIIDICKDAPSALDRQLALQALEEKSGLDHWHFRDLVNAAQVDLGQLSEVSAIAEDVKIDRRRRRSTFSATSLFPNFGKAIEALGKNQGYKEAEAAIVGSVLAVSAGQIHGETVLLAPSRNTAEPFKTPAIYNFMLVGDSGIGKDVLMNIAASPARDLRNISREKYEWELAEYKQKYRQWEADSKTIKKGEEAPAEPEKPQFRRHIVDKATVEGINRIFRDQPNVPMVEFRPELASQFKGFGQYKNGGGNDREAYLEFYDGHGSSNPRADGVEDYVRSAHLSVLGGIQPSKLRSCMGRNPEEDSDGLWARYGMVRLPDYEQPWSEGRVEIGNWLENIYSRLANDIPRVFHLSPEAKELAKAWFEETRQEAAAEESPFFRPFLRRSRAAVSRIALIAHLINAAAENKEPESEISAQTYAAAIDFAAFSVNQAYLIFSEAGVSTLSPEAEKIAQFTARFSEQEIYWADVRNTKFFKKNGRVANKEEVTNYFKSLCELGEAKALAEDYSRILVSPQPQQPDPETEDEQKTEGTPEKKRHSLWWGKEEQSQTSNGTPVKKKPLGFLNFRN